VEEEITVTAATTHDYSVWGLVMQADPVVKGVMILLVLMSIACWAIIFEKLVRIGWLNGAIRRLAQSRDSRARGGLSRTVLEAGERELDADLDDTPTERRYRAENAMRFSLKSQIQKLEVGLPFLATIGSAAPFIGLFGTVWGIVNSFTAIATALGLAAAIPAVVAYNQITVALGRSFARGNSAVIDIARDLVAGETEQKPQGRRGTNVEPLRAGKRS
jgi:biopolymer transport protein ExbB/TolQ